MVTIDRKKLEQVLEALNESWHLTPKPDYVRVAITDIKEALAQPAQEPVATFDVAVNDRTAAINYDYRKHKLVSGTKLYTTPPQRPWVGLTDEEIKSAVIAYWGEMKGGPLVLNREYVRAIEATLKEKNT